MNWNTSTFSSFPFPISAKGHVWSENPEFGEKAGKEFSKLWFQIFEKGNQPERDLRRFIQQWPDVPGFQFLLAECAAYRSKEEADRILQSMAADFPGSLFTAMAALWRVCTVDADVPGFMKSESIPGLDTLFPDRGTFHAFEVYAFETMLAGAMLCKAGTETRQHRQTNTAPMVEGKFHFKLQEQLIDAVPEMKMRQHPNDVGTSRAPRKAPPRIDHLPEMAPIKAFQTELLPVFRLEGTSRLYRIPPKYDHVLMGQLLQADRKDLIADLETILEDVATRFFALRDDPDVHSPAIHALLMLCHLQAIESLPAITQFLSRHDAIMEWWLGDAKTEYMKLWLALLIKEDMHAFDNLILDPEVNLYVRDAAIYAFEEVGVRWPECIATLEPHLLWLLDHVNATDAYKDIDDLCTLNTCFADIAETLALDSLQPKIAELIEEDLVNTGNLDWHVMYRKQFLDKNGVPRDRVHLGYLRGMYSEMMFLE